MGRLARLKRLPGWRARLEDAIDAITRKPFDWEAQHDCGLGLAANVVRAITGQDVAARFRGTYSTREGALRTVKRAGCETLGDLVATILPEVHPSQAKLGDLVAFPVETAFGHALGVVNGDVAFVLREEGVGTLPLLGASRAFKVG